MGWIKQHSLKVLIMPERECVMQMIPATLANAVIRLGFWQLMCTSGRMHKITAASDKLTPWGGDKDPFVLGACLWIS